MKGFTADFYHESFKIPFKDAFYVPFNITLLKDNKVQVRLNVYGSKKSYVEGADAIGTHIEKSIPITDDKMDKLSELILSFVNFK